MLQISILRHLHYFFLDNALTIFELALEPLLEQGY